MGEASFACLEAKTYRFNLLYRVYHFAVGATALVGVVLCYKFWALSMVLALFAIFMIVRPLVMKVTVDAHAVTFKAMFSESSLQRSSVTAFERIHPGKRNLLMLRGEGRSDSLTMPADLLGFDEAWEDWLNTHTDLSDDKPISLF